MGWIGLDICQGLTVLIKDTVLGLIVIFTSHLNKFKNSIKFQVSWTLSNIFACTIKIMFSIALIWVQIQAKIIPILICQCLGQRDHYVTYCFICMIRCHGIKTGGLFSGKKYCLPSLLTCHKGHHDHLHSVITMHFERFFVQILKYLALLVSTGPY